MSDYHPASHRRATWWHVKLTVLGLAHIIGGLGMVWFHGVAARNHWRDR